MWDVGIVFLLLTTFRVVVLYTWEDPNFKKTQPSSKLIFDIAELVLQDSASPANEKERQMFGQDTIRVVDEITTKVGVDEETSLAIGSVKKGMALIEARAGVEGSMIVEKVPSLGHETGKATSASESLVKKLKNVVSHN